MEKISVTDLGNTALLHNLFFSPPKVQMTGCIGARGGGGVTSLDAM
tara:strand:+ start:304 stop:441 length:138 start_codon:yes stop_codon:yes gene_type:complete